jgi:hypothetical protein
MNQNLKVIINECHGIIHYLINIYFEKKNINLNKPSGSKGARHHAGGSLRRGPYAGELNLQACFLNNQH